MEATGRKRLMKLSYFVHFQISAFLLECREPALELTALPLQVPSPSADAVTAPLVAYLQGNVTASRKKILPLVKKHLIEGKCKSTLVVVLAVYF